RRRHDQPATVWAGPPANRTGALGSAPGADGRQDQAVEPQHLPRAAEPAGGVLVDQPQHQPGARLAATACTGRGIAAHVTLSSSSMPSRLALSGDAVTPAPAGSANAPRAGAEPASGL